MTRPEARRLRPARRALITALTAATVGMLSAQAPKPVALRGLEHGEALAATYHAILDADFEQVPALLSGVCPTTPAWCTVLDVVARWWQISLDVSDRSHDREFVRRSEAAIAAAAAWTEDEPQRAEAWFALGAAHGARAQWRVARQERLAAARDGKHIKLALERALLLDPTLHDAKFGLGLYRYYADVAPAALRFLRWLLLLPDGDRKAGLQQMLDARARGVVIRGEADYQLHLVYLWYEHRSHDALALIRGLEHRYPRNPLFALIEAEIHDVYFHDVKTSEIVLRALLARAEEAQVNAPELAMRRARLALSALHARGTR